MTLLEADHEPQAAPRPDLPLDGTAEPVLLSVLAAEADALAADEPQEQRAAALVDFGRALRSDEALGRWADCDLFAVLDVDGASVPVRERRSLLRSGSLRTVLVFAPVMVTWAGLLFAGRAYAAMTAAGEATAGQSFLQLWLTGFGGRTVFSLTHVAAVAVVLIAAAIAVSVGTDRRQVADERDAATASVQRRHRLHAFAARATVALAPHRSNAAEQLGAHFERGLTELGRLVAETIRLHADTSTLVAAVRESSGTAITAANAAQDSGQQVGRAAERLSGVVSAAMTAHAELVTADRAQHTSTLRESTSTLAAVMAEVKDGCAEAVREGLQGRDRVLSAVEGVSASIESLATHTSASMSELTASAEAMTRHSADFGTAVTGHVAALSSTARESVETMHATVVESVEKVTTMTGEAFSEHVAAAAERASAAMDTLRRDVERTSVAAEQALGTASRTLTDATAATERRAENEDRLIALLQAQNEVMDSWRGVETRLASAALDMHAVPRWLETVQNEHVSATAKVLTDFGVDLRQQVSGDVRQTLSIAQDDHVRQVNRAYRDASRELQIDLAGDLTRTLGAAMDQLPQRLAGHVQDAAHEAAHHAAQQAARQAAVHAAESVAAQTHRAPVVAERRPERYAAPHHDTAQPDARYDGHRDSHRDEQDRRAVRPPARETHREPQRETLREALRETQREARREPAQDVRREPAPEVAPEPFVVAPPRSLSSVGARRYAQAGA